MKKNMVTIPVPDFVELVERSARLSVLEHIMKSDVVYTKSDLAAFLSGNKTAPDAGQNNTGAEEEIFLREL